MMQNYVVFVLGCLMIDFFLFIFLIMTSLQNLTDTERGEGGYGSTGKQ